jgi:hypothetical protein
MRSTESGGRNHLEPMSRREPVGRVELVRHAERVADKEAVEPAGDAVGKGRVGAHGVLVDLYLASGFGKEKSSTSLRGHRTDTADGNETESLFLP